MRGLASGLSSCADVRRLTWLVNMWPLRNTPFGKFVSPQKTTQLGIVTSMIGVYYEPFYLHTEDHSRCFRRVILRHLGILNFLVIIYFFKLERASSIHPPHFNIAFFLWLQCVKLDRFTMCSIVCLWRASWDVRHSNALAGGLVFLTASTHMKSQLSKC